jgi:hypothetical protein
MKLTAELASTIDLPFLTPHPLDFHNEGEVTSGSL